MSALSALGGSSAPPSSSGGLEGLTSQDFLEIIFTELANQDPLEPSDTSATLEQLSMLRSIESDEDLVSKLDDLISRSEFASASSLIGQVVSGVNTQNQRVTDIVISVSQTSEGAALNLLDGSRVMLSNLDEITLPIIDAPPEPPVTDDTDDDGDDEADPADDTGEGDPTGEDPTDPDPDDDEGGTP